MNLLHLIYFIVYLVGCFLYYKWAQKKQIVDTPNERSSHTHQPVRGMGVVFPILFALFVLFMWKARWIIDAPLSNQIDTINFVDFGPLFIGLGVVIAGITGYIDDRVDLRSYVRLPLYTLSAFVALLPVLLTWTASFLYIPILLVVIVGIINTYNFMDGINGITGFYSLVLLFTVICLLKINHLGVYMDDYSNMIVIGITYLLAFGIFNYRSKAIAFLGDSGSVSLGLFACILLFWVGTIHQRFDVIILLSVYGVDSVGTIILRLLRKENIFKAHRSHLYQDLVHVKGLSHLKVAGIYAIVQLIINVQYLYYFEQRNIVLYIYLVGLISIYLICKKSLGTLNLSLVKS
jgi:UDP-GlcNAc:undecaprenyl-phosphate/decaprenyl-phosphate GlcNAc-1-phosphate transferase